MRVEIRCKAKDRANIKQNFEQIEKEESKFRTPKHIKEKVKELISEYRV
ncbi:MAG: hypothetical protein LW825_06560 [Candidatus Jidaibacter sp.]|jgi:hypothetical protein|nr:hypothetical protein [Candidatus Jidaibacter sp.]